MRRLLGTPEGFVFGLLSTLSDLFRLHTERFRLCLSFLRQTLLVPRVIRDRLGIAAGLLGFAPGGHGLIAACASGCAASADLDGFESMWVRQALPCPTLKANFQYVRRKYVVELVLVLPPRDASALTGRQAAPARTRRV